MSTSSPVTYIWPIPEKTAIIDYSKIVPQTYVTGKHIVETQIAYDKSLIQIFPRLQTYVPSYYSYDTDLNQDAITHTKLIDYFYLKAVDKWLHNDFDGLLDYFEIKKGKVKLISDTDKKNKNIDKKYYKGIFNFIEDFILKRKFIRKILTEYVSFQGVNWYDLYYHSKAIKDLMHFRLKKKIKKLIRKSSK